MPNVRLAKNEKTFSDAEKGKEKRMREQKARDISSDPVSMPPALAARGVFSTAACRVCELRFEGYSVQRLIPLALEVPALTLD